MLRWLEKTVAAQRPRYVVAWLTAIGIALGMLLYARFASFHDTKRAVPDYGHAMVDWGWQWLMGRALVTGHPDELYARHRMWQLAQDNFPRSDQRPNPEEHDAEELLFQMLGEDDPDRARVVGDALLTLAADNPLSEANLLAVADDRLTDERLDRLSRVVRPHEVAGALYPPIHAFAMAPFAMASPQTAYFGMQWVLILATFLAGLGVSVLSRGRFWWPVAAGLIMLYPGFRGALALGQNAPITLAILVWGWVLSSRGRPIAGGAVWGLLAYKPIWAISFCLILLLMRRWRMFLAMGFTGVGLALATVPVVGVQTWLDWLHVGQEAAALYNVDTNWVSLSRDLFGIPRRFFIDFELPLEERDNFPALLWGWVLWLAVLDLTMRVTALRGRSPVGHTGPLPALMLMAAWVLSYRFMYYDALLGVFGLMVLFAHPGGRFFRPFTSRLPGEQRGVVAANSAVLTLLALLFFVGNIARGLDVQGTFAIAYFASESGPDVELPELRLSTAIGYPWDTVLMLGIWLWCAGLCFFERAGQPGGKIGENSATLPQDSAPRLV